MEITWIGRLWDEGTVGNGLTCMIYIMYKYAVNVNYRLLWLILKL